MGKIDIILEGKKFPQISSSVALIQNASYDKEEEYYLLDTGSVYDRDKLILALKKRNIKPSDIKRVILSHWHVDHIGNIDLFSDAEIITTNDCIETNIELCRFMNSLKSKDKVGEMTNMLFSLFPDSGNSYSKFRAMANLSIKHRTQIEYICRNKNVRIINDAITDLDSKCIMIFKYDCHTKEDLVTEVKLDNRNVFFMGDVMNNSADREFLNRCIRENLPVEDDDILIPGHGAFIYWNFESNYLSGKEKKE